MEPGIQAGSYGKNHVKLDPRTKLFLLVVTSTLTLGGGSTGVMKWIRLFLCVFPFVLLFMERRVKEGLKYLALYLICIFLEYLSVNVLKGTLSFLLLAVSSIMTKFAPGIMMGAFFLGTTSISEFVAAMERMHVSEKIVIPMSVIFRFFPTIEEEYRGISDAMEMRQISFTGKKPGAVIEYRLVPLMISVVKIGDELSQAALTRGLGAPVKRTNMCKIGFRPLDVVLMLIYLGCVIAFLTQRFVA